MGRHLAPAPQRRFSLSTPDIPGRRTTTATAGFLVGGAAVALTGLTVFALTLLGVPILPRGDAVAAPAPSPSRAVPAVDLADTPAQQTVVATLSDSLAAGWVAASALTWSGGTAFDASCGRPDTDAAIAGTRIYAVGGQQVVVTVSTYTAGAGAVALAQWSDHLRQCSAASTYSVSAPGVDGEMASLSSVSGRPAAAALFWRRGDVVAMVALPGSSPTGLAETAARVDTSLMTALPSRCTSLDSAYADAARSPWIRGITFTGLTVSVPVTIAPTPLPTDQAPSGVPLTWSASPLPTPSYPTRPADPVWPSALPTPVAAPVVPSAPPSPVLATGVPSRQDDPVGPGCGWAFTGMVPPPFDQAQQAAAAEALAQQAQAQLTAAQAQYVGDVVAFWQAVPQYQTEAAAFTAYVDSLRGVAFAWDSITAQRTAYQQAVAAYDAAVLAHNDFLNQQSVAQSAYDAALAQCSALTSSPTPTPLPTDTTTASATPTDTASPTPTLVPGCPPEPPAILTQTAPTIPPVPSPPPDPRPSADISPTR